MVNNKYFQRQSQIFVNFLLIERWVSKKETFLKVCVTKIIPLRWDLYSKTLAKILSRFYSLIQIMAAKQKFCPNQRTTEIMVRRKFQEVIQISTPFWIAKQKHCMHEDGLKLRPSASDLPGWVGHKILIPWFPHIGMVPTGSAAESSRLKAPKAKKGNDFGKVFWTHMNSWKTFLANEVLLPASIRAPKKRRKVDKNTKRKKPNLLLVEKHTLRHHSGSTRERNKQKNKTKQNKTKNNNMERKHNKSLPSGLCEVVANFSPQNWFFWGKFSKSVAGCGSLSHKAGEPSVELRFQLETFQTPQTQLDAAWHRQRSVRVTADKREQVSEAELSVTALDTTPMQLVHFLFVAFKNTTQTQNLRNHVVCTCVDKWQRLATLSNLQFMLR